jgi:hypothetical protein
MNALAPSVPGPRSVDKTPSTIYLKGHGFREFTTIAAKVRIIPASVGQK